MSTGTDWFGAIAQSATAVILFVTIIKIGEYVKATKNLAYETLNLARDTNRIAEATINDVREWRISDFINKFHESCKDPGRQLELLLPAGINNLLDEQEIIDALTRLKNKYKYHPFEGREDAVQKVGYKEFFHLVIALKLPLDHLGSVDKVLDRFKSNHKG